MKKPRLLLFLIITLAFTLRIYELGKNPSSLYWDEASLGYNAYTIATSGRDEHGEFFPPARFIAFGDYKPPGYIYASVPSILLFGLNEFSVRLPSMMAGVIMVIVTFFIVKELFKKDTIALLSSFLLAISPWSLQFSRAAFEANVAACFNLLGIYLFVLSKRKKWTILPSIIFFIFSFYTFNANRIIAPLIIIGLSLISARSLWKNKIWFLSSLIIGLIFLYPSISYLSSRESRIRFQEVSIFTNLEVIKLSNQRIAIDQNSLVSRIIHNRRILFAIDFLKHYFDNFTLRFLFTHGDVNPRLSLQDMGQLYIWELPFLILGIYLMVRRKEKGLLPLLIWLLIVPIPAGMARETPHALRITSILPTYQIISAYGIYQFIIWIKNKSTGLRHSEALAEESRSSDRIITSRHKVGTRSFTSFRMTILIVICFLLTVNFYYYIHNYYIHYPINWSGEWQYGYKQMVEYVSQIEKNYDHIFVTDALGRPYIYFAFYQKYPLENFLTERKASRDWFGFWNVEELGKIKFRFDELNTAVGKILLVTTAGNLPDDFRLLSTIKNLRGDDVFLIGEKV